MTLPLPGEESQWKMAPRSRMRIPLSTSEGLRKAAVLIPLFEKQDLLHIVLTLRSAYDGIHSAQVSFPGGKFEENETDPFAVALRESEEELGIQSDLVEIIGSLSPVIIPVSSMLVYPVVGWLNNPPNYSPDIREVQKVIESPIYCFKNEFVKSSPSIITNIKMPIDVPYYEIQNEIVWGATAMMISELMDVLRLK